MKKDSTKQIDVKFQIISKPGDNVYIAGTFNDWNSEDNCLEDENKDGLYNCTVPLDPGEIEYKYKINDCWVVDPNNLNTKNNDYGTLNNILMVNRDI